MQHRRLAALCISIVLPLLLCGVSGGASAKSEIKGAAILDHPCGKTSVKQMGLIHAGKMEEGNKLATKGCRTSGRRCPPRTRR
jgi:hypothetical protein